MSANSHNICNRLKKYGWNPVFCQLRKNQDYIKKRILVQVLTCLHTRDWIVAATVVLRCDYLSFLRNKVLMFFDISFYSSHGASVPLLYVQWVHEVLLGSCFFKRRNWLFLLSWDWLILLVFIVKNKGIFDIKTSRGLCSL